MEASLSLFLLLLSLLLFFKSKGSNSDKVKEGNMSAVTQIDTEGK